MLRHLRDAWDPTNEGRIRKELPVVFITGEADPVSDGAVGARELEARYRAKGIRDVTRDVIARLDRVTRH